MLTSEQIDKACAEAIEEIERQIPHPMDSWAKLAMEAAFLKGMAFVQDRHIVDVRARLEDLRTEADADQGRTAA